jgi:hypothetical protein
MPLYWLNFAFMSLSVFVISFTSGQVSQCWVVLLMMMMGRG